MPVRARSEQAPHFPAARQIPPIPGPEGEVLPLARLEAGQPRKRARSVLSASAPGTRVLGAAALVAALLDAAGLGCAGLGCNERSASLLGRGALGTVLGRGGWVDRPVGGAVGAGQRRSVGEPGGLIGTRLVTLGATVAVGRNREPVVRIGPQAGLPRILAGHLNLSRQGGKLMAATLADDREELPVQHQPERDLIRPARLVMARDRRHAEQRSIHAA